ncbi:uncharacterized protein LDX57_007895 [Aspergillus melleus]|uniref:uncharacterized protein n=1 Tax=Aspergillus melleus TaxID=138277 RepID=UPI001E8EEF3F|nr:uncharacterized protein LDX57_007895 [Aspergillus melleus]KAH8430226.1 hypothetical protein LDX57_007895 [Aspergillus melleus]
MNHVGFIAQDKARVRTPGVSPSTGEHTVEEELSGWHIGEDEMSAAEGLIGLTEGPRLGEAAPRSDVSVGEPDMLYLKPEAQPEMADIAPSPLFFRPPNALETLKPDGQISDFCSQTIDPCCLSLSAHRDADVPLSTSSSPLPQHERLVLARGTQSFNEMGYVRA